MHWSYGYCCGFTVVTNKCWDSDSKKSRRFFQEMNLGLCLSLWTMSQGCWKLESEKKSLFRNGFFVHGKRWLFWIAEKIRIIFNQHFWYYSIYYTEWWFQMFFIFTPIWGRFPCWLIFFKWVETTNSYTYLLHRKDVINVVTCMFITDSPYLNLSSNTISALSALRAFRLKKSHMTGAAWRIIPVSKWLIIPWWWQLKYFFIFIPTWGKDPIWLIFFKWVGSTTS